MPIEILSEGGGRLIPPLRVDLERLQDDVVEIAAEPAGKRARSSLPRGGDGPGP